MINKPSTCHSYQNDHHGQHMKVIIIFFSTFLLHFLCLVQSQPLAPALYVFGDSLFDSGNNNILPTFAKANYLPYGANFPQGATGRFTNGRTIDDFIAEYLGLPYPPPYITLSKSTAATTGFNYASGSCGILPETGSVYGKCLNLKEQINLFERTVEEDLPSQFNSSDQFSEYLSKSIYIFSIGSNDYLNNYLETTLYDTSKQYPPQPFAQLLIGNFSQQLERLYNLGARKVIVFDIGPIGCIPAISRKNNTGKCEEETNNLVWLYDKMLPDMLRNLTSSLRGSMFVFGHASDLGYDAIKNPSYYGLTDSMNPCCTTWANGTSGCIPLLTPCPNPNKHFFWDAYHLTEVPCSIIATQCFNGTSVCLPVNIQRLVRM